MSTSQLQPVITLDDVWRLFAETSQQIKTQSAEADHRFQETDRRFQETDRRFKETDCKFKETIQENKRLFQEAVQENKRLFQEAVQENKRLFKETDLKFQETDRIIKAQAIETKRLEGLFTSQWGKLMESLVEGDIVGILNRFGIEVMDTSTRVKGHTVTGQQFEFDIIAHNGDATVVIEVKTTLRSQYVKHFIDKLNAIKTWLPRYANNTIYGAMAFLTADAGSETMAENLGLIVIRATGDSATIVNKKGFMPRGW